MTHLKIIYRELKHSLYNKVYSCENTYAKITKFKL